MTRRVAMAVVTTAGQLETTLRSTDEVLQIVQEWLAAGRVRHWDMLETEVALEHVLADHQGRSDLALWPAAHRLIDETLRLALGHSHVTTTWPGE